MSETPPEEPTPVCVTAPFRRPSFAADMFADLIRSDVTTAHRITDQTAADRTKVWAVTFTGTEPGPALSDAEAAAVRARMESTDDTDEARRAQLRADRDALPADDPQRRLYDYVLGD